MSGGAYDELRLERKIGQMSSFLPAEDAVQASLSDVVALIVLAPKERGERVVGRWETLASVLRQATPPRLVIVVETSLDATLETEVVQDVSDQVLPRLFPDAKDGGGLPHEESPRVIRFYSRGAQRFGSAIREALDAIPEARKCSWMWLLHDDMVANTNALETLLAAGQSGESVGAVGPKQVHYGAPDQLLEIGIDATSKGRRVYVVEPDEIDQGQHDRRDDVLAVGTAGMLVRSAAWNAVGGLDPALGPFGDGLEFGRRLWQSGYRVVVAPRAVVEHAQASYGHDTEGRSSFAARRTAQMYNWGLALTRLQFVAFIVGAPFLSLGRSFARLFSRTPSLAFGELAAYVRLVGMTPALLRGRARLQRVATVPRSALSTLEASPLEITKHRRNSRKIRAKGVDTEVILDPAALAALKRHHARAAGGFIGLMSAAIIVSVFAWYPFREGLIGGQWGALPSKWSVLAAQAWSGWQITGDGLVGPSSPLLAPLSIVAAPFALLGISPQTFAYLLVFAALPLAAWGGWSVASSFTRSTTVRVGLAALWATSGSALMPLMFGNLAVLCAYLSLPAVVVGLVRGLRPPVALVAHGIEDLVAVAPRNTVSWLGLAGLGSVFVVVAAPIALMILPVVALLLFVGTDSQWLRIGAWRGTERPRSVMRWAALVAVTVPGLVVIAPSLVTQLLRGDPQAFLGWALGTTLGNADLGLLAGLPAALPLAGADSGFLEAVAAGSFPALLIVGGSLSGIALTVWTLAAVIHASWKPSQMSPMVVGSWGFGLTLSVLALLQAWLGAEAARVSPLLIAGTSLSFLVAVGASYANYSLTVSQLVPVTDYAGRWARGLPAGIGSVAALLSAVSLLVLGPVGSAVSGSQFVQPAPSPLIPVIAQESQNGPRAARFLTVTLTDGEVQADLMRGVAVQQADLRVFPAPTSTVTSAVTQAHSSLASIVATMTARPTARTSSGLADHGIDIVMLSAHSEDFSAIQSVLDATGGLERIGNLEGSTMWRVRPDGRLPARVSLLTAGEGGEVTTSPVDSGSVGVKTTIAEDATGFIVMAEAADPGWIASLDGVPLTTVEDPSSEEGWRQAFELPNGGGELEITYRAPYLYWWWAGAGLTLMIVALMALPRSFRRRSVEPWDDQNVGSDPSEGSFTEGEADE